MEEEQKKLRQILAKKLKDEEWSLHKVKAKDKAIKKHELYEVFHLVYDKNDCYLPEWYVFSFNINFYIITFIN